MNEKMNGNEIVLIFKIIAILFLLYLFTPLLISILYIFPYLLIPVGIFYLIKNIMNGMAKTHAKTLNKKEK